GGAARHNVYNLIGVVALAAVAGLPLESIRAGLRGFTGSSRDNPGRLNVYRFGGATAIVDFAHNPHGMDALAALAAALPAERRLVVLGQAGDRDDHALRELARSARPLGQISGLFAAELVALGAAPESIVRAASEYQAVMTALAWTRPGDLLVLPTHAERGRVLTLMEQLQDAGWEPGQPLPA